MPSYTPRYHFKLADPGSVGWDDALAGNFNSIDALIAVLSGTQIGSIASAQYGRIGAMGWLETAIPHTETAAQFNALSTNGNVGIIGATRTSDNTSTGGNSSWGGGFFAINDKVGVTGHGIYTESRQYAGCGPTLGIEATVVNFGAVVEIAPYSAIPTSFNALLWGTPGRNDVAANYDLALGLGFYAASTGAKLRTGIMFNKDVLAVNATGFKIAMDMAKDHTLAWRNSTDGGVIGVISSIVTTPGGGGRMYFENDGIYFQGPNSADSLIVKSGDVIANGTLHVEDDATFYSTIHVANTATFFAAPTFNGLVIAANDPAAASAGVMLNQPYINTSTHAMTIRLS